MADINSLVESVSNEHLLNVIALLFLFATSILILLIKEFRADIRIFLIILTAVIIRNILIIINVFISPLPGSDKDAIGFIKDARETMVTKQIPEQLFGSELYDYILSVTLDIGIDSILFIVTLNNLIFFLSISFILKILNLLDVNVRYKILCLFIIFLYPSLLFNSVSTLREPLQFFFITLSAFIYIYLIKKKFSISLFFVLNLAVIGLGLLHNGLLALIPIIMFFYIYSLYRRNRNRIIKIMIATIGMSFIFIIVASFTSGLISSPLVDSIIEGNSVQYTEEYREASLDTRASYKSEVSFSNPLLLVFTSLSVYIKYFLFPLPWQISSIQDFVPLFENIFRLIFLYFVFKYREFLSPLKLFIVLFLVIEFVWALGTSNWGTASRHHIISSQLLIISFVYVKYKVDLYKKKNVRY